MNNYRLKVEKRLKRKLKSLEIVHHEDGNNYNDKHKNLKICTSQSEHAKIKRIPKIIEPQTFENMINTLNASTVDDLKKSLHTIFTPYQITIIYRKLQKKYLSKTDREVFSRIIKKKLVALANNQLFDLAQKVIHGI